MYCFYTPLVNKGINYLSEDESRHCVKVLRLRAQDTIQLLDGEGNLFSAVITTINTKKCKFEISQKQKNFNKRNYKLHVALAPTKNIDRFEWFLEKTTEIGIDEITPILCEHSERKVFKQERSEKIIISAMKQALVAYKPKLNNLISFKEFIFQSSRIDTDKFIAHCDEGQKQSLLQIYSPGKSAIVLIGPEGDFSPSEISLANKHNFTSISLGNNRLRTETAGIVACSFIKSLNI